MTPHPLLDAVSFIFIGILAGITIDSYLILPMYERRAKKEQELQRQADAYAKAHGMQTAAEVEASKNRSSHPW